MTTLYILIGINVFLQLCILGYIYNLEQEYLKIRKRKNDDETKAN